MKFLLVQNVWNCVCARGGVVTQLQEGGRAALGSAPGEREGSHFKALLN